MSSFFQFAFILQTSSSAIESPARKALENNAQSDFFWLLVSSAFVAVGIFFEYPEVKRDFSEWLRSRKKSWVIDPKPPNRNRVPLWSLVGFLIVIMGVAGEGIYEGLLGMNDTKLRQMDEASLAADELQIAQLQSQNLKLQKQAGDAAVSAHSAANNAKEAKTDAAEATLKAAAVAKNADSLTRRLSIASSQLAVIEKRTAWRTITPEQKSRLQSILMSTGKLLPLKGMKISIVFPAEDTEASEYASDIADSIDGLGASVDSPAGVSRLGGKAPVGIVMEVNPATIQRATPLLVALSAVGIAIKGSINDMVPTNTVNIAVWGRPRPKE